MKKLRNVLIVLLFISSFQKAFSQEKAFIDEFKVNAGYMLLKSDFGQRGNLQANLNNAGIFLDAKVYFNILSQNYLVKSEFAEHLKFSVGINMGYSKLNHYGAYVEANNHFATMLKAMHGKVFFGGMSINSELHLRSTYRFDDATYLYGFDKFDPYAGIGFGYYYYKPTVTSDLGDINTNPTIVPSSYVGRIYNKSGFVPTIDFNAGIRYRYNDMFQFDLNADWKYFVSDKVDGLVPNLDANKYNDWVFTPSFGIVYFLFTKNF